MAGAMRSRGGKMAGYSITGVAESLQPPVIVQNQDGASPFVLVCDHASNRIPERYGDMGLQARERFMHIAWDPGALAVAQALVALLDAPLVHSTVSRLVIDCNRPPDSAELIPTVSERTVIPANRGLPAAERAYRLATYHRPFHDAVAALLDQRESAGRENVLVTIHSYTPVYLDVPRPWPIGLIHGCDARFTRALHSALHAETGLDIGWNEPYAAHRGVTYTLEHHGDGRDIAATMIEIRNNEILEPDGVQAWAARVSRCLEHAHRHLERALV